MLYIQIFFRTFAASIVELSNTIKMKKYIINIIALLGVLTIAAQEHMEFKGIPMDGTSYYFANKLMGKGYNFDTNIGNTYILKGEFTGEDAEIFVFGTKKTGTIWKVSVFFEGAYSYSWKYLKLFYEKYVDLYITKYGTPTQHNEFFSYPYKEGDGKELEAIQKGKCFYNTFFELKDGVICVCIMETGLTISYEDQINSKIFEKEKEETILDDI